MWRNLTVMLFLMVLVPAANASSMPEFNSQLYSTVVSSFEFEQQSAPIADSNESSEVFNLPRFHRLSPTLFSAEIQTSPNYVLVIEFFNIKHSAGVFKNLINPPLKIYWFEQLSHNTNSSRISGWKDGNFLYSARTTYHS